MRALGTLLALVLTCGVPGTADAAGAGTENPRPRSLDELLELVRQGSARERAENERREGEFLAAKQTRASLLAELRAELAAEEQRSELLERAFNTNEQQLARLQEQLTGRLGALGELFGVVRQVAGDTRGVLEDSLVSAQLPGRTAVLDGLASSRELPSIEELETLWYLLQQEATESGKVVRFRAPVVGADGVETSRDVVRVGVFNAAADGRYLRFMSETGRLVELARQPGGRYRGTLDALASAHEGRVGVALDPSRGAILALLIRTPSFLEQIQQGKLIGYVIIGLGLIGLVLAVGQWGFLWSTDRRIRAQMQADSGGDNPLGRIFAVYEASPEADVETLELKLDEAILKETPGLERFLTTVRVISVVAPLLGLLGTVTGMIQTFQAITLFGTGDPKLMAGGISEALVTTMLGLSVAIPLILLHSAVGSLSRSITQVLEEQSAGIIADHAERGGSGHAAA